MPLEPPKDAGRYAESALALGEVAAVVLGGDRQSIWATPAFDRLASDVANSPSFDLLPAVLACLEGPSAAEGTNHPVLRLPDNSEWRVAAQALSNPGEILLVVTKADPAADANVAASVSEPALDLVTALPNRATLQGRLDRRFASPAPFALLFIDIDGFKQINDTLGHLAGDQALRELAARMRGVIREHDFLGRFGGDEFLAIIEGVEGPDVLSPLLERLDNAVREPLLIDDREISVSASIGAALSIDDYDSSDAMLHAADIGMYATRSSRETPSP